jgi:hypothetical protein
MRIPGVDRVTAATIIAEIVVDMSAFRGPAHLASWADICPGNYQNAGRQHGGKTRKGNVWLNSAVITAAITGARKRGSYLTGKYRGLRARRGAMRAAVAIAYKIPAAAFFPHARQPVRLPGTGRGLSRATEPQTHDQPTDPSCACFGMRRATHAKGGMGMWNLHYTALTR